MYNILELKSFHGISNQQGTPVFYREVCHYIAESIKVTYDSFNPFLQYRFYMFLLQRVEENWASGTAYLENSEKYQEFRSGDPDDSLKMNEKWIVRSSPDGLFEIFNRWTCTLEKVVYTI